MLLLWHVWAAPLFEVEVNLDLEALNTGQGVTMYFEKLKHAMRLDAGLGTSDGLSWGSYVDSVESTGWGELHVASSANIERGSNSVKMYAAGYVEGILTCVRISQHYHNMRQLLLRDEAAKHSLVAIVQELETQLGTVKAKSNLVDHIRSEEPIDPYYKHARYLLFQLWGLTDGYNYAATHFKVHTLKLVDMMMLSVGTELPTMMDAFTPPAINDRMEKINSQSSPAAFLQKEARRHRDGVEGLDLSEKGWEDRVRRSHCSGFVRLAEGYSDLFVGHTTWNDYSTMLRIFKYYEFPLAGADTMATKIAMSSYPGALASNDDFYVMDSGLVVIDTSLELLKLNPWDDVQAGPFTGAVPSWMHVMITNRMAKKANDWASSYVAKNNLGTKPAQWTVVDYNLFTPGIRPPDNTMWIAETIPAKTHIQDMTYFLYPEHQGYWGSYDRPYFDDMQAGAGFTAALQSSGRLYSWSDNPRATIFRNVGKSAGTAFDVRGLMNRNMYPMEGFGEPNEPSHAISARNDLSTTSIPNGGIDAKVVSRCLQKSLSAQAISGPTHDAQTPFRWLDDSGRELFPGWAHVGQPDVWNFGWVQFTPVGTVPLLDVADC